MNRREQEAREEKKARREARKFGYEYRPGALKDSEDAARLSAGFELLDGSEDDDGGSED